MPTMLAPTDIRDIRTFDLEVLTPIHIGTREGSLKATEFLVDGGKVHLLDEDRFAEWLKERNLIDAFVDEAKTGRLNLKTFLQRPVCKGWREALSRMARSSIPGGTDGMQEFRPMIRDASGQVFLPGTAIKGVLRTAVLQSALASRSDGDRQMAATRIGNGIRYDEARSRWKVFDQQSKKGKEHFTEWLQKELLGSEPHHDLLRCLTVRDTYPAGPCETRVIELGVLCRQSDGRLTASSRSIRLWVEAVMPGARFRVTLLWDRWLREPGLRQNRDWIPGPPLPEVAPNLESVLSTTFSHHEAIRRLERDTFQSATEGDATWVRRGRSLGASYAGLQGLLVRIGFGAGMLSTTVNALFPPELNRKIRNACGHDRQDDPAPKSRRVWVQSNGTALPMGWGRLVEPKGAVVPPDLGAVVPRALPVTTEIPAPLSRPVSAPATPEPAAVAEETWPRAICVLAKNPTRLRVTPDPPASPPRQAESDPVTDIATLVHLLGEDAQRKVLKKGQPIPVKATVKLIGGTRYRLIRVEPVGS